MGNRRGEVLTTLAIVLGLGLVVGTVVPQINPLNWFKSTPNTESGKEASKETIRTPLFYEGSRGVEVAYKVEERSSNSEFKRTPKLTLMQKVGNWISNLSFFWFVVLGLGLLTGMVTPAAIFARLRHVWKTAFKNTVDGIRAVDDEEAYKKVTAKIAQKQDKRDKRLVDRVKQELH
jgi:hypothetical protein